MRGSIIERPKDSGRFTAYWFTKDPATGKRVQHSKGGFSGERKAQSFLNTQLGKVETGGGRPDEKMSVERLLNDWLAAKKSSGLRPNTARMYQNVVNRWLLPHIGGLALAELSPTQASRLVATLRSPEGSRLGRGPLSDRSVQLAMTTLKAATAWAHETGKVAVDPLSGYRRPRSAKSSKASGSWSPAEARTFLSSVADDRLRAAWWLLLGRGIRRGELCGLRWANVDLEHGLLSVVETRVMVGTEAIESTPKTDAGVRRISLDRLLVDELRSHRARQSADRLRAGEAWQESGLVFVDELGAPLLPQTVSRRFDALVAAAKLRRIRLHDTRHTAASMMLADGTPVHVASRMLGHSSPTITLSVYAHVLPGQSEEAGERQTQALAGTGESLR